MSDSTPDLVALAAQVKVLSGDLNRRFEILSGDLSSSVNQLNSRMDALSTSRKVALPFKSALAGDWLEGTTSPRLISHGHIPDSNGAVPVVTVAAGRMFVLLPNLSRIGAFRASARVSDALQALAAGVAAALDISLQRTVIDRDIPELVVPLICPFVPGIADLQGDPIPGKEFVDNDRFKYFVSAAFSMSGVKFSGLGAPPMVVQQGKVVFESFEVDCIVT